MSPGSKRKASSPQGFRGLSQRVGARRSAARARAGATPKPLRREAVTEIRRTLSRAAPSLPYEKIATRILGKNYQLSLVICGDDLARRINKTYRQKTYAPNVLSFPYAKNDGEIFLNVRKAEREARQMGIPQRARLALLFVHGCFHLKGHAHGAIMERHEQTVLREFHLL